MTKEEFANLLNVDKETEHIEFKKAEKSFNFDNERHSVCGYCVALANERGGKLVLGVSDKIPREFIGTKAFFDTDKLEKDIFNFWKRRASVEEYFDGGKRALIIDIPSRPIGEPLQFKGQYLMRVKDSLESMTLEQIKKIINISIKSPGGFPEGVNIDNIINESKPRNKLIADTLYKCDFVEHFGNGVNLMYQKQLSLGKNPPDYSYSDENRVVLNLDGMIKDIEFAKYVFRVANEKQKILNDQELIVLNTVKENKKVKAKQIADNLLDLGLVEKVGYGKYILSKKYYDHANKKGECTRRKGLDREANKLLIIEHLKNYKKGYMKDFMEVLKNTPKPTISKYLNELKQDKKIEFIGNPKISKGENASFWKIKFN